MISGGNATIIVEDMDASIRFYTEVLGLELTTRFGDHWATVRAGEGLTIGIHPVTPEYPTPSTRGSVILGLEIDVPIEDARSRLASRGVSLKGEIARSESGNFLSLRDPDGNEIYLWEKSAMASVEPGLPHPAVS